MLFLLISCAGSPREQGREKVTASEKDSLLKYPVVLVHGIIAHDRRTYLVDFWGRIPDILKENGIDVFLGNTDAWGSCESNAEILKSTIDKTLLLTEAEKVNIIAHSKGGLDSRYLIWKYDYGDKIASLTTVSTPHHGAELADLIFQRKIIHSRIAKNALKIFGELYGDSNPDLYNVNHQLTTDKMKEFNEVIQMDPGVYCQSIYTTLKNSFDDMMFFYSHWYIKSVCGPNDGMVSEKSAKWGDNTLKIEGISHAEILDYKKRNISRKNIPDIYLSIVRDLSKKGF